MNNINETFSDLMEYSSWGGISEKQKPPLQAEFQTNINLRSNISELFYDLKEYSAWGGILERYLPKE